MLLSFQTYLSHTHTLCLSLSHTHTLRLSLTRTHSVSLSHTYTHSVSLSHVHTHVVCTCQVWRSHKQWTQHSCEPQQRYRGRADHRRHCCQYRHRLTAMHLTCLLVKPQQSMTTRERSPAVFVTAIDMMPVSLTQLKRAERPQRTRALLVSHMLVYTYNVFTVLCLLITAHLLMLVSKVGWSKVGWSVLQNRCTHVLQQL